MDTLFAIAVALGVLKGNAAPPPAPKPVTTERREAKSSKPRSSEPSLGY
jgi:hypothetical protein